MCIRLPFQQTQFEAWLAFRKVSSTGLDSTTKEERLQRTTVTRIYETPPKFEEALEEEWAKATPSKAIEKLASPDVIVTSQYDKRLQLKRITPLHKQVGKAYEYMQPQPQPGGKIGGASSPAIESSTIQDVNDSVHGEYEVQVLSS